MQTTFVNKKSKTYFAKSCKNMEEEKSKVVFKAVKKRKAKNFRSRANRDSDEEDDKKSKLEDEDEVDLDKLEETKEIQKLRQRLDNFN